MTDTTLLVTAVFAGAWGAVFVIGLLWGDIEAWWRHRRARAARRAVRPLRYVPTQRSAR